MAGEVVLICTAVDMHILLRLLVSTWALKNQRRC